MHQLRLFLSVLSLLLLFVPVHAQNIDTKVYYRLTSEAKDTGTEDWVLDLWEDVEGIKPAKRNPSEALRPLWRFQDLGNGFFRMIHISQPNLSLEVVQSKDIPDYRYMALRPTADRTAQQWKISGNANGFRLTNRWQADQSIEDDEMGTKLGKSRQTDGQVWKFNKTDIKVEPVQAETPLMFGPVNANYGDAERLDKNFYYRLQSATYARDENGFLTKDDHGFLTVLEGWLQPGLAQSMQSPGQLWRIEDIGDPYFRLTNGLLKDQSLSITKSDERLVLSKTEQTGTQAWVPFHIAEATGREDTFILVNGGGGRLEATQDQDVVKRLRITKTERGVSTIWILIKTDVPVKAEFELTSTAFVNGAEIPATYTGKDGISPPLAWKGAPAGTKSFMILCTDPDAPSPANPDPNPFVHWFMLNIPADTNYLLAGIPRLQQVSTPVGAVQLFNGTGETGYIGPMPPAGSGKHRYFFTIFSMDRVHVIDPNMTIEEFSKILESSVLAKAELMGTYEVRATSMQDGRLMFRTSEPLTTDLNMALRSSHWSNVSTKTLIQPERR
ncbi:YbhB/YbcL family Raf kinase inhibitor-like protein [bacterium]|nr:YbhB/YbcL family Raf kinase inhibitor-like protein [bacterium]